MLGKVGNSGNIPGVLKQSSTTGNSSNRVSWSDVVCKNLQGLTYAICISTYLEIKICDVHGPLKDGAKQQMDLHMMCWREIVKLERFWRIK